MNLNRISLVFTLFLITTGAFSQNSSSLAERFDRLQSIDNPGDKRFATNEAFNDLLNEIQLGNKPQIGANSALQSLSPTDSSFTIYYQTTIFDAGDYQLDWVVSYKRTGQNKAYRFTEKITNPIYKSIPKPQLIASLEKYQLTDTLHNYYKLSFNDKSANQSVFTFADVLLKAYFYELADLKSDDQKLALNNIIDTLLLPLFKASTQFNNRFEGLDKMGTIISADEKVKVITWNYVLENGDYHYFGYVIKNIDNAKVAVSKLTETIFNGNNILNQSLNANHWFGNEYYQIVDGKDVKNNKFYTLIGGRTNGEFTKTKVVDILWFAPNGDVRFGSPLFEMGKGSPRRLIYEYSFYSSMMMRYDTNHKMIVMDHLSPKSPEFRGNVTFNVPDFSYDALTFENGKWTLLSDIDLRNPSQSHSSRKPKSNKM